VEGFRQRTMNLVLEELTGEREPRPVLRNAVHGWLGYMDAAILDWTQAKDVPRETLRNLMLAVFGGVLMAAQQADPEIELRFG